MIKVNFLSSFRDTSSAQAGTVPVFDEDESKNLTIAMAKRVGILLLGPLALSLYEMKNIPELIDQKQQADARYEELKKFNDSKQGLAEEIKKYEDEHTRFNAQMDFVNKIQADRLNEYKLFMHLKESTPGTVWVNQLSLTDNILQINGESIDASDITQFQEKLSNSDFIMSLVPLDQKTRDNAYETDLNTTIFQVKATLKTGAAK